MSNQRTKDLVLVNLVSGRAGVPLQADIAPREFEGVRFVLELVTESVPREVIVGGEVEVGDADAAGAARRRVDRRIRVVGRRVDHVLSPSLESRVDRVEAEEPLSLFDSRSQLVCSAETTTMRGLADKAA